jgi:LAGLIDADG-like domain
MNPIGKLSVSNLPSVFFDGVYRVLACIPETEESKKRFPKFNIRGLDQSQWQETDLQWYNMPIWDQGATSSCVGHGSTLGMQYAYVQSGRKLVEYNPFFVYGLINNGRDAGAMVSDALRALMQYGTCPHADLQPGMMFQSQFPAQAFTDALQYKLENAFHCQTFEDICSAISLGFVCPLGIYVDHNFGNLDSEGVSPLPQMGAGGGHCVLGMGLKKSSRYGWVIKIQNSWGCYDSETEILTDSGWKKFEKIEGHELIATLNSNHELEYQKISKNHVYDYDGDLLHHKSRDVDLLVTPNHRMYYKTNYSYKKFGKNNKGWEIKTADSLPKNIHFKKNAYWSGEEKEYYEFNKYKIPMDLWLEFMGYFISEGYTSSSSLETKEWKGTGKRKIKGVQKRNKTNGKYEFVNKDADIIIEYERIDKPRIQINYTTGICQTKLINLEKIQSCLEQLPFKFTRQGESWITNNKKLFMELRVFGKASQKYIPNYIKKLSSRQLKIFYDALMLGDGCYSKCKTGTKVTYYTSSINLANDTQELLLKLGYAGDISFTNRIGRKNKNGVTREIEYRIGIKTKELEQRVIYNPKKVNYKGKVYCVTVPNGIVYVRRNGKSVWSGNSRFGMNGFSYIHKGHFQIMQPDAFAVQSVIDAVQDNNPPDVKGDV